PSPGLRATAMIGAAAVGIGWLLIRTGGALFRPITDHEIAMAIARRRPALADTLLTAIELDAARERGEGVDSRLAALTRERAEKALSELADPDVVRYDRVRRWGPVAAALSAGALVFAAGAPGAFDTYVSRLALSPAPWPRRVQLSV